MKLSLGCGSKIRPAVDGWVNHDRLPRPGVDLAFDLSVLPWPVKDLRGHFDLILAEDVLEHVPCNLTLPVMDECWKLLAPGGTMLIQTPVFGSYYHLADLTHCRGFILDSFDIFDPETFIGSRNPWYTDCRWQIVSKTQDATPLDRGANLHFVLKRREK